ncbi:hypothetical protein LIER_27866 [Lithospermum erythrorhizon]|uniref:Uncharacterized protein n=1 Tax=Lithospermum erythrorhizon TaxID=34254 RepID=A0AAV3RGH8_LITER
MMLYLTTLNMQRFLFEEPLTGMVLSGMFRAKAMIEKISPSWRYFKNYLKHKRKDMNLEKLSQRLKKEGNRKAGIMSVFPNSLVGEAKANIF